MGEPELKLDPVGLAALSLSSFRASPTAFGSAASDADASTASPTSYGTSFSQLERRRSGAGAVARRLKPARRKNESAGKCGFAVIRGSEDLLSSRPGARVAGSPGATGVGALHTRRLLSRTTIDAGRRQSSDRIRANHAGGHVARLDTGPAGRRLSRVRAVLPATEKCPFAGLSLGGK